MKSPTLGSFEFFAFFHFLWVIVMLASYQATEAFAVKHFIAFKGIFLAPFSRCSDILSRPGGRLVLFTFSETSALSFVATRTFVDLPCQKTFHELLNDLYGTHKLRNDLCPPK